MKMLTVRIGEDLYRQIELQRERDGINRADYVRAALVTGVRELVRLSSRDAVVAVHKAQEDGR